MEDRLVYKCLPLTLNRGPLKIIRPPWNLEVVEQGTSASMLSERPCTIDHVSINELNDWQPLLQRLLLPSNIPEPGRTSC